MTGRHPQSFGHEYHPIEHDAKVGLALGERTIANRLHDAGYDTALIGKWHLGFGQPFHPRTRGFAFFFGMHGGGHDYFISKAKEPAFGYRGPLEDGDGQMVTPLGAKTYLTDVLGEQASAWLKRPERAQKPFFLALTFNAPHTPIQPKPAMLARLGGITGPDRRAYASLIVSLDDAVGRVLKTLDESGAAPRTLIAFLSDNGGPNVPGTSNAPLRGYKGSFHEGGIRVPFLLRLPGRIPAGGTCDAVVSSLDLTPTALALAGAPAEPGLDGADLLPVVNGGGAPTRPLFWRWKDADSLSGAIRIGDRKLVVNQLDGAWRHQLYAPGSDPGEATNLAASEPEHAQELLAAYQAWSARMREPAFPALGSDRVGGKKKR